MIFARFTGIFIAIVLQSLAAGSDAAAGDLALKSSFGFSKDPLTTEKAWILDPSEVNPHRQRWLIQRRVELVDLAPREVKGAKAEFRYAVSVGGVAAAALAYVRADGPWFRPMSEYPCTTTPAPWFGTPAGARAAADSAGRAWERVLASERLGLAHLLVKATGPSPGMALEKARVLFAEWLKRTESTWRSRMRGESLQEEWKVYQAEAKANQLCSAGDGRRKKSAASSAASSDEYVPPAQQGPVPWEIMMEAPAVGDAGRAGLEGDEIRVLARAPAKLWDGLFSVRLNLIVSGRKLNGTFLIDSGVGTSVISPEFLTGQGVIPSWLLVPGAPFRRVPWGSGREGGLAPVVSVDRTEIGNTSIQLQEFALFDTEFFSQPENPVRCCDGVLGTDFLRRYVVELQPGPPAEIKLWPAESFHLVTTPTRPGVEPAVASTDAQWIEAALTPAGEAVSNCIAHPEKDASRKLVGVRWDTGREDALDIHVPWQSTAKRAENSWQIRCGPASSERVAREVPASFPRPEDSSGGASITARVPAFTVGMELLSQGRVFFDFPHGRLWFPDKGSSEPLRRDHSGLVVRYEFSGGKVEKRVLVVKSIRPGSPAQALLKRGLRPGMKIHQIDKIDVDDFDARQVSRRFAGVYGENVLIQWQAKDGLRLGAMKVR